MQTHMSSNMMRILAEEASEWSKCNFEQMLEQQIITFGRLFRSPPPQRFRMLFWEFLCKELVFDEMEYNFNCQESCEMLETDTALSTRADTESSDNVIAAWIEFRETSKSECDLHGMMETWSASKSLVMFNYDEWAFNRRLYHKLKFNEEAKLGSVHGFKNNDARSWKIHVAVRPRTENFLIWSGQISGFQFEIKLARLETNILVLCLDANHFVLA